MQNEERSAPPALDEDTLAFARKVFEHARAGRAQELAELLDMGLPPNLLNENGDSLLDAGGYHGHADAARALLAHGGDPALANDRGQTPLAAAAFKGELTVARVLLEGGADVNGSGPDSRTALMTAAMFNRTEMVDLLLAYRADIEVRDAKGLTAQAAAQAMGASDAAERLARAARRRYAASGVRISRTRPSLYKPAPHCDDGRADGCGGGDRVMNFELKPPCERGSGRTPYDFRTRIRDA